MGCIARTLLLSALTAALAVTLPAQRFVSAPSSTAIGAGALHFGPSSTARSNGAARSSIYTPGFGRSGDRGGVGRASGFYGRNLHRMPFAYWLAPYYYGPLDYLDSGDTGAPAPDYDTGYDPNVAAAMAAQNALVNQVRNLSAQVAQLEYGQQMEAPPNSQQQPPAPPQVPVTLVLRNGQQLQVQNYAVMDRTFWDFSNQPVRKIPLSSIDINASEKATQANGGEFPQMPTP